jgi:hypothetical protein
MQEVTGEHVYHKVLLQLTPNSTEFGWAAKNYANSKKLVIYMHDAQNLFDVQNAYKMERGIVLDSPNDCYYRIEHGNWCGKNYLSRMKIWWKSRYYLAIKTLKQLRRQKLQTKPYEKAYAYHGKFAGGLNSFMRF